MAFGTAAVSKVESYITTSYTADDGALDLADWVVCATDGVSNVACDEIKTGVLVARIEIDTGGGGPSSITALAIRFQVESYMATGTCAVLPYTDANSVSATNENSQTYTATQPTWITHTLSSAFIAQLGDLGGGIVAVRFTADDGLAKPKISEIEVDITVTLQTLAGVTRDKDGAILGSCKVALMQVTGGGDTLTFVESQTSNATTGAYSFDCSNANVYQVVFWKSGSPNVFDVTDNDLVPV